MSGSQGSTVLELARPQCAAEVLGDEVVALNVESGIYFSMRGLAAALWHDLAAGCPVEMLAEHAREQGASSERVTAFAEQLTRYGLMRSSSPRPFASELAATELLRGGGAPLVFEVYDDMQDLILSDPIHDVDETMGWPDRQSQSA